MQPFGPFQPHLQRLASRLFQPRQLPPYVPQQPAQDRPLPLQHLAQTLELPRVRVATGATTQLPSFLLVALLQFHSRTPRLLDGYFASTVGKHGDEAMIGRYVKNQGRQYQKLHVDYQLALF